MSFKRERAFVEEQILCNYQSMYRLAYTYVKNESDALDIVQESAYKAMKSWSKLNQSEYCKTWLLRIVINTSIDVLNKNKREVGFENYIDEGEYDSYSDLDLMDGLEHLNEKERSIVMLRYFEDRKLDEISEVMGLNISTVKSILYRALDKLKENLT